MVLRILAIAMIVACGAWLIFWDPAAAAHPAWRPLLDRPVSFGLLTVFGAAMIPVLFAYGGFQTSNYIASEIREPRKNLPRALLLGVAGVIALYLAANFIYVEALSPAGLAATSTPASEVMHRALGSLGGLLIAVTIAISTLGFLSQAMLVNPRVAFAMAQDGVLPRIFARLDPRSRAPIAAIALQGAITTAAVLLGTFEQILSYVVVMDWLFFGLSASCLFVFRWRDVHSVATNQHGRRTQNPRRISRSGTSLDNRRLRHRLRVGRSEHNLQISSQRRRRRVYPFRRDPRLFPFPLAHQAPARLRSKIIKAMSPQRREIRSGYIEWAKLRSKARYSLASSDVSPLPLADLHPRIEDFEISGADGYGYAPLLQKLSEKSGVPVESIVQSQGTSMANHLAMAALLEPGDEVLIEEPSYEAIVSAAEYLGAKSGASRENSKRDSNSIPAKSNATFLRARASS